MLRSLVLVLLLTGTAQAQFVLTVPGVYQLYHDVVYGADGAVYVAGSFSGTTDFDPTDGPDADDTLTSSGGADYFVARYGSAGALQWVIGFGSSDGAFNDFGPRLAADGARVYVSGNFGGTADFDPGAGTALRTSLGGYDAFLAAYDAATGAFVWADAFGSTGLDFASSVAVDEQRVYLGGAFEDTIDLDPGSGTASHTDGTALGSAFLAAYDTATGAYEWSNAFEVGSDREVRVDVDAGRVFIVGQLRTEMDADPGPGEVLLAFQGGTADAFVAAYGAETGAYDWAFALGSSGSETSRAVLLHDGRLFVAGVLSGGTVDFDPGPAVEARTAGMGEQLYLAAYTAADGSLVWVDALTEGGLSYTFPQGLAADGNRVYVTGAYSLTVDFDPGPGTAEHTWSGGTPSNWDVFLAAYDAASGAYRWANALPASPEGIGSAVAVSGPFVSVVGGFPATLDLDPGPGEDIQTGGGLFLAPYDAATGAYRADVASEPSVEPRGLVLRAAPNPASGLATLTLTLDGPRSVAVSVVDVLGREVDRLHEAPLSAGMHPIPLDTSALPPGLYVVRATAGRATVSERLTVVR